MPTLLLLVVPKVVVTATYGVTSDDKVGIMKIRGFHWNSRFYFYILHFKYWTVPLGKWFHTQKHSIQNFISSYSFFNQVWWPVCHLVPIHSAFTLSTFTCTKFQHHCTPMPLVFWYCTSINKSSSKSANIEVNLAAVDALVSLTPEHLRLQGWHPEHQRKSHVNRISWLMMKTINAMIRWSLKSTSIGGLSSQTSYTTISMHTDVCTHSGEN